MEERQKILPPVQSGCGKKIVVIGGGVTGVLSALELAAMDCSVTLVEARHIGSGASSRSAACIRAQFGIPTTVRGMIYAIDYFKRWSETVGGAQGPIKQNGYLFLKNFGADRNAIQSQVAMQRQAGLTDVEWLDESALNERFPFIDAIGLIGATWCPRDGFLYPNIIYQDGAEAAARLGAEIIQNDEVVGVRTNGSAADAVILRSGKEIAADVFVNAANVWAPRISQIFGGLTLPIMAERRYLYFLSGLKADSEWGLDAADFPKLPMIVTPGGAYCRPENKQLMVGWLQYPNAVIPTLDNQDDVEPGYGLGFNEYGTAVRKEVQQFLPAVQDMGRLEAVTTGFYDTTPDHNPLFGFDPLIRNLIHAAGFSGHGLMHAPFSARIVAELAAAGRDVESLELPFDIGRADLSSYRLNRAFDSRECMVI